MIEPLAKFPNPCEWNQAANRAAWYTEAHASADFVVSAGDDGQWRLCASCAALPRFKRFSKRPVRKMTEE